MGCQTHTLGPSAPGDVVVSVTISPEVCLRWRRAHLPRGSVVLYKVYAEPITASRDIRLGVDLPVTKVIKVLFLRMSGVCSPGEISAPVSVYTVGRVLNAL